MKTLEKKIFLKGLISLKNDEYDNICATIDKLETKELDIAFDFIQKIDPPILRQSLILVAINDDDEKLSIKIEFSFSLIKK